MRVLGIIPARGGSKGITKKNVKLLLGKPLLAYTTEEAIKSSMLTQVIVSSEDEAVIAIAKKLGVEVPFVRPLALAQDDTPSIDVILHAIKWYETKNIYFDAVCLLQVTNPFKTAKFIDDAIKAFIKSGADALVSVKEVPHEFNPHWVFKVNDNKTLELFTGESKIISRRQDLPKVYHRDGIIYLTKTNVLLKDNSLFGKTLAYIVSPMKFHCNIDTMDDWDKAEVILRTNKF